MKKEKVLVIKGIRIDPSILRKRKIERCRLSECLAACCTGGIWMEPGEKSRILQWAPEIKRHLLPQYRDESEWFALGDPDERFPEGHEVGTMTVDDPLRPDESCCIFLRQDRTCALQVVSEQQDLGWPGLKPFYCALYPLYLEDGILMMDDETPRLFKGGGCRRPASKSVPLYRLYREEAILALGSDGYEELCRVVESQSL